MDSPSMVPQDVRLARSIRALRDAVIGCGAACLGLAVIAAAILVLSDSDPLLTAPVVTILGGGQLLAIVGAALGALGLRGALTARPLDLVLSTTRSRLRGLSRAVLVWCVAAAAAWAFAQPATALVSLALAAVTAQLAAVLVLVSRRLDRRD